MRATRISVVAVVAAAAGCVQPTSGIVEPLRILNWSPAAGSTCVPTALTVFATFSSDLVASSVSTETFQLLGATGPVVAEVTYDQATFTIRLHPQNPLGFGQPFTAIARTALASNDEGALGANIETPFLTTAPTGCAPGIQCHVPVDCPGAQVCGNVGLCIDACVTDRDCYHGTCATGACAIGSGGDSDVMGD